MKRSILAVIPFLLIFSVLFLQEKAQSEDLCKEVGLVAFMAMSDRQENVPFTQALKNIPMGLRITAKTAFDIVEMAYMTPVKIYKKDKIGMCIEFKNEMKDACYGIK